MSLWQTESWQNMLIASWQSEEYFIVENNIWEYEVWSQKIYAEKRKVSLGEYGLFVIGFEWSITQEIEQSLAQLCREEKSLFIQIESIDYSMQPLSLGIKWENLKESYVTEKDTALELFKNSAYKKFIPSYTVLIDLQKWEKDILASMKQKGRYNIRLAVKKWIVVEQVEKHSYNVQIFYDLMQETTERDKFSGNTREFYMTFLEKLENSQLFFAYHDEEVIAAGIFVVEEWVMTYYYGASKNHKRNLMAPYLLQWTAIEHAIKRGCKIYDFLWVAPDEDSDSSLIWVTDFKMKFFPQKKKVSDSYLYVHKKWKYLCISLLRSFKKS